MFGEVERILTMNTASSGTMFWGNFFRGGIWKRGYGSRTETHNERRGKATGP
jgi:hypothetical protein